MDETNLCQYRQFGETGHSYLHQLLQFRDKRVSLFIILQLKHRLILGSFPYEGSFQDLPNRRRNQNKRLVKIEEIGSGVPYSQETIYALQKQIVESSTTSLSSRETTSWQRRMRLPVMSQKLSEKREKMVNSSSRTTFNC